jgi:hypothetical protein
MTEAVWASVSEPMSRREVKVLPLIALSLFILAPKMGILDLSALVLAAWFFPLWLTSAAPLALADDDTRLIPLIWIALLCIALLAFMVYGRVSTEILLKPVRQLVLLAMLIFLFRRYRLGIQDAVTAILLAAAVNGGVVLLQYVLDAMHVSSNFLIMPGFDESVNVAYRKPGLTSGYPVAGMLSVFGIVLAATWLKARRNMAVLLALLICLASVLITSRMALLFAVLAIGMFMLPSVVANPKLSLLYGLIALAGVMAFQRYSGLLHYDTVAVMFELFINLSQGQVQTASSSALLESYGFLPDRVSTLLLGNGYTNLSDTLRNVDAGIQTVLFSSGAIAMGLYVAQAFLYMRKALRGARNTIYAPAVATIFAIILFSNLKMDAWFSRVYGDAFLLLVAAAFVPRTTWGQWPAHPTASPRRSAE